MSKKGKKNNSFAITSWQQSESDTKSRSEENLNFKTLDHNLKWNIDNFSLFGVFIPTDTIRINYL